MWLPSKKLVPLKVKFFEQVKKDHLNQNENKFRDFSECIWNLIEREIKLNAKKVIFFINHCEPEWT